MGTFLDSNTNATGTQFFRLLGGGDDSSHGVAPGLEELPLGAGGSRGHLVKDWLAISASSAQRVHQEVMD